MDDVLAGAQLVLGVDDHRALLGEILTDDIASGGRFVVHAETFQATRTFRVGQARFGELKGMP